jgi:hypothetical protein
MTAPIAIIEAFFMVSSSSIRAIQVVCGSAGGMV